jgi:hypothetical protein
MSPLKDGFFISMDYYSYFSSPWSQKKARKTSVRGNFALALKVYLYISTTRAQPAFVLEPSPNRILPWDSPGLLSGTLRNEAYCCSMGSPVIWWLYELLPMEQ